jgi:hypothetical protein
VWRRTVCHLSQGAEPSQLPLIQGINETFPIGFALAYIAADRGGGNMSFSIKPSVLLAVLALMALVGYSMIASVVGNAVRLAASAVWGA